MSYGDLLAFTGTLPAHATTAHQKQAKEFGRVSFTLADSAAATEELQLNKAGRALLKKYRHFKARLLLTATDAFNRVSTKFNAVMIK